ncbi:MAG: ATP-binding protein [Betaproteobacteria bacterium]|nr:ATP-binding protein [Betaproteobacteria bacterium]
MTTLLACNYPANTETLATVRSAVLEAATRAGASTDGANDIVLAVNEACMNVIQHGYRFAPDKVFRIELSTADDTLEILLCDNGEAVSERQLKPRALDDLRPGGLGVHFIRALTDTMTYLPPDDTWRNRLQMKKRVCRQAERQ